jgi:hypothetical protein
MSLPVHTALVQCRVADSRSTRRAALHGNRKRWAVVGAERCELVCTRRCCPPHNCEAPQIGTLRIRMPVLASLPGSDGLSHLQHSAVPLRCINEPGDDLSQQDKGRLTRMLLLGACVGACVLTFPFSTSAAAGMPVRCGVQERVETWLAPELNETRHSATPSADRQLVSASTFKTERAMYRISKPRANVQNHVEIIRRIRHKHGTWGQHSTHIPIPTGTTSHATPT